MGSGSGARVFVASCTFCMAAGLCVAGVQRAMCSRNSSQGEALFPFWLPGSHACAPHRATFRIKLCWLLDLTGEGGADARGARGVQAAALCSMLLQCLRV